MDPNTSRYPAQSRRRRVGAPQLGVAIRPPRYVDPIRLLCVRSAILTAFVFFVVLLGTTVPTPLLPLYERDFGVSPLGLTVIFGVYAIGVVACLLMFGHLSDEI